MTSVFRNRDVSHIPCICDDVTGFVHRNTVICIQILLVTFLVCPDRGVVGDNGLNQFLALIPPFPNGGEELLHGPPVQPEGFDFASQLRVF